MTTFRERWDAMGRYEQVIALERMYPGYWDFDRDDAVAVARPTRSAAAVATAPRPVPATTLAPKVVTPAAAYRYTEVPSTTLDATLPAPKRARAALGWLESWNAWSSWAVAESARRLRCETPSIRYFRPAGPSDAVALSSAVASPASIPALAPSSSGSRRVRTTGSLQTRTASPLSLAMRLITLPDRRNTSIAMNASATRTYSANKCGSPPMAFGTNARGEGETDD